MTTARLPLVKLLTVDGWRNLAFAPTDDEPEPPADDDPGGWAAAFAARDFASVEGVIVGETVDWFEANTGHDPELTYADNIGNLTVTESWLSTNVGNGRVTYDSEADLYTVERYRVTGEIRVNTTTARVRFSNLHHDNAGSTLYGLRSTTNCPHVEFEDSTINGNGSDRLAINFPDATEPDQVTFRRCNFYGYRTGIYCFGGISAHYCYVHDLFFTETSHNTGASIRARNCTIRRCLIVDGNSSAISCYAENSPYTGILLQENCLRLPESDTGSEVLLGKQYAIPAPGETRRMIDNVLWRGNISDGVEAGMTELTGNVDRNGDPVP